MFLTEIKKNLRFISLGRIGNLSRLSCWLQTFWFASLTIILISNLLILHSSLSSTRQGIILALVLKTGRHYHPSGDQSRCRPRIGIYIQSISMQFGVCYRQGGMVKHFFFFKLKINCKVKWIPTHTYEKSVLRPKLGNPDSSFIP